MDKVGLLNDDDFDPDDADFGPDEEEDEEVPETAAFACAWAPAGPPTNLRLFCDCFWSNMASTC